MTDTTETTTNEPIGAIFDPAFDAAMSQAVAVLGAAFEDFGFALVVFTDDDSDKVAFASNRPSAKCMGAFADVFKCYTRGEVPDFE